MFTNGWFLEEYAFKLKKAGLDSINVSLDSHIPEKHDQIKNLKGSFKRAVAGIKSAKKAGMTVGISCTINKESLNDGTLVRIIEMGKKLGVHEVIVWDLLPTGGCAGDKGLMKEEEWREEIIKIANFYNKKQDYPGIFTYVYNRTYQSVGCSGGTNYFYINPYGDVCPCDFNPLVLGNVFEKPLYLIWDEITRNPEFFKTSWTGCKIKDKEYRRKTGMEFKKGAKCKKLK
jgi:MoaA/NifB/PqqE/SkfB family radical SAM enzyme